jgi:hypothetical protein
MTAGLTACAAGVGVYSTVLRERFGPAVGSAVVLNAAGTCGLAATPLDSPVGGSPHVVAAGLTYASLAAIPLLAARTLRREGRSTIANLSVAAGVISGMCLAVSASGRTRRAGLFQRVGLTIGHGGLTVSALRLLRRDECCLATTRRAA